MDSIIDSLIDLINAAQRISDGGFDVQAFLTWKTVAFITLFGLLGPFNYYTRNFGRFTTEASREWITCGKRDSSGGNGAVVEARIYSAGVASSP